MDLKPVADFSRFFHAVPANSDALRDAAYRLRFGVYCREFGYEPAERFPDCRETDPFDDTALHCLVIHTATDRPAACVRLVPGSLAGEERPLPFEVNCAGHIHSDRLRALNLPRDTVCEISRLAVDRGFRRRRGEQETRFGNPQQLEFGPAETRTLPLIAVSAYLAATAMTELAGRRNVFAMMEPFLPRLMSRVGIQFEQVGEAIEYHGLRAPYFIRTESALESMAPPVRSLYHEIYRSLSSRNPRNGASTSTTYAAIAA